MQRFIQYRCPPADLLNHKASSNLYGNRGIKGSTSIIAAQICSVRQSFSTKHVILGRTDSLKSTKVSMDTTELMPFPSKIQVPKTFPQLIGYSIISDGIFFINSKSTTLYLQAATLPWFKD